jgi:ectoine hydroxylase-related dioxygenase (phytanoyl-CoA dioxygenase family)
MSLALRKPSAASEDLTDPEVWADVLSRDGFCIIRNAFDRQTIRDLASDVEDRFEKTPFSDGDFYGRRTKRFGGLLKRSDHAKSLIEDQLMLGIANAVLGPYCDCIQLNLTQAISIYPGETLQAPHRDQDMWAGPKGQIEYLINVMIPFVPYREVNGATVLWRGSHRWAPEAAPDANAVEIAEMDPGDVLIFLGSTLHCGGANRTDFPRSGLIVSYSLGWLKPYENQWLVYPPEIARTFSPKLAELVGYRVHRPNLGNYEGQCPSVLFRDQIDDYLAATDEVKPDQAEALAAFKQNQKDNSQ